MTELSPAARAVFDAYISHWTADPYEISPEALAAALRAAATMLRDAYANDENDFYVDPADDWLDDIAAELEGATR